MNTVGAARKGFSQTFSHLAEIDGIGVPVFRGGGSFALKPGEYKINGLTGLVKTSHGVSVDIDAATVSILEVLTG